jgi:hypothetical protein
MQAQHCLVGGGDACTQQHFRKQLLRESSIKIVSRFDMDPDPVLIFSGFQE